MYKLKQYQKEGSDFIIARKGRAILTDEMGLGKTLQALDAIYKLNGFPVLIVGIKPALYVWKDEISKWFDDEAIIYSGNPKARDIAWNEFIVSDCKFLITNYAFVEEVKNRNFLLWKTVVTDEYHLPGLLNRKTLIFKSMKLLTKACKYLIMITGTPMRSNLSELYAPFHLIDPEAFPSYWKFVGEHCIRIKYYFGYEIEARPKDVPKFIKLRTKYMIRRTKDKVMPELPPKIRQVIPVEMTPNQKKLYDSMTREMLITFGSNVIYAQNEMVKILRQRQLLVTPKIFDIPIFGGALECLAEMIEAEFIAGNPVAVFTPFRKAIPYITEAIVAKVKEGVSFFKLHGGMSAKALHYNAKAFQDTQSVKKVMIGTIKSGTAVTITAAKVCFFIGYEWKAYANAQAEDRLHRIGQIDSVRVYYLLYRNTADERVKELINKSQQAMNWVFTPQQYMQEIKIREDKHKKLLHVVH